MKNFKKRKLNEARRSHPSLYSREEPASVASDEREHEAGGPHHSERAAGAARGGDDTGGAPASTMTSQEKTKLYWDIIRRERKKASKKRKAKGKARKEALKAASVKDWTEYHRLGSVLAEALRVKNEEPRSSNAYVRALLGEDKREERGTPYFTQDKAPGSVDNPEMEHTPPKKRGGPAKRFRTVKGKNQVRTQKQDGSWGPWKAG